MNEQPFTCPLKFPSTYLGRARATANGTRTAAYSNQASVYNFVPDNTQTIHNRYSVLGVLISLRDTTDSAAGLPWGSKLKYPSGKWTDLKYTAAPYFVHIPHYAISVCTTPPETTTDWQFEFTVLVCALFSLCWYLGISVDDHCTIHSVFYVAQIEKHCSW